MRRPGRRSDARAKDRSREPATHYYEGETDRTFAQRARERTARKARRRLLIQLAILAVLAFAAWMWGPSVIAAMQTQARQTAEEFQEVGEHIRDGRDRRSGANFDESAQ
jgi:fatty acid desaturase